MLRIVPAFAVLVAASALCGCNETTGPVAPVAATPAAAAVPVGPNLPEGAACTGDYRHFQAVLKDDVETGNLDPRVFDQIQADLSKAAAVCAAGRDGEARAIIHASKEKHGYHG